MAFPVEQPRVLTSEDENSVYMKEIQPALSSARALSNKWHDKIKKWRALYNLSQHSSTRKKPGEMLYPDPTALNVVDLFVGVVLANELEWTAMGFSPDPEEERDSSRIEKYLAGTIEVNSERIEQHIPYEVILNFGRDGCGILYTVWDHSIANRSQMFVPIENEQTGKQETKEAFAETPINTQPIDPLKMHLLPGGPHRWAWVFREEDMTLYDFETTFGVRVAKYDYMNTETQKRDHKGKLVDCWRYVEKDVVLSFNQVLGKPETKKVTAVQRALIYDDMMVWELRDMPGYNVIPYHIGFFKPVNKDDPEQWGHSIIAPMEPTIKFLEQAVNRRSHQIDIFTAMPMIVRANAGRDVQIDPGFDNYEVLEPDETIEFPRWPGNPPDVDAQINFYRARLQQSGFTDVMFGSGTGDAAGYALNMLTDQNRIRLVQPTKQLEMLFSRWAKHVLDLTRSFAPKAAVRVYGRMRGKDFAQQVLGTEVADYMVRARLDPEFPNDQVRNHAMGTQASPFLSRHTLLSKYFDIEQPDDEINRQMQEQAMMMPEMQQFLITETLMAEAKAGNAAAALVLQQMYSGGGVAGPQGRPKAPMGAEQPMGLQSPTGQPTRMAAGGEPMGQDVQDIMRQMTEMAPGMGGQVQ